MTRAKNLEKTQSQWLGSRQINCLKEKTIDLECSYNLTRSRAAFLRDRAQECNSGYAEEAFPNKLIIGKNTHCRVRVVYFITRCNNCLYQGNYPDSATVHIADVRLPYANWLIVDASGGKVALQADTGNIWPQEC